LHPAGVTRDSIIQLARRLGYDVIEEPTSVHEAMDADEVFTTGMYASPAWMHVSWALCACLV
jgi:branched-subunit amino acid aminotransferase/4-amino-4-deoxychorismate lyase